VYVKDYGGRLSDVDVQLDGRSIVHYTI